MSIASIIVSIIVLLYGIYHIVWSFPYISEGDIVSRYWGIILVVLSVTTFFL